MTSTTADLPTLPDDLRIGAPDVPEIRCPAEPECPCGFGASPGHDWVLGIEDRGLAGLVDLMDCISLTLDHEAEDLEVPTWDLEALEVWQQQQAKEVVTRAVTLIAPDGGVMGGLSAGTGHP